MSIGREAISMSETMEAPARVAVNSDQPVRLLAWKTGKNWGYHYSRGSVTIARGLVADRKDLDMVADILGGLAIEIVNIEQRNAAVLTPIRPLGQTTLRWYRSELKPDANQQIILALPDGETCAGVYDGESFYDLGAEEGANKLQPLAWADMPAPPAEVAA